MLADAVPLSSLRRALIIKLRHHGDVLLVSPVLSVLKKYAPQADIDALVYSETADMLTLHPALARLHTIDRNWKSEGLVAWWQHESRLMRSLRERRYDLIVHLTDHWRGARIARATGARWSVAPVVADRGRQWERSFTHLVATPRAGRRHVVEAGLDALRRIGIQPTVDERWLTLVPGEAATRRAGELLAARGLAERGFIHVHPSSRWFFKCWPVDHMAELIGRLQARGHAVLLTAAPDRDELAMVDAIQRRLATPAQSLAGELGLKELAAVSARATLFVGVDSAPMHIAAAMRTPVVALFGPSGEGHWHPWTPDYRVVAENGYTCRPCGIDGCGGGKVSDCLVTLAPARVLAACEELLGKPPAADH
jgi:heptosyltransferase-3